MRSNVKFSMTMELTIGVETRDWRVRVSDHGGSTPGTTPEFLFIGDACSVILEV